MVTHIVTACHTAKGLYKAKGPYHDRVSRLLAFWEEGKGGCSL
jgi:hypothetical protein